MRSIEITTGILQLSRLTAHTLISDKNNVSVCCKGVVYIDSALTDSLKSPIFKDFHPHIELM